MVSARGGDGDITRTGRAGNSSRARADAYVRSKIEKNIRGYGSSGGWTRYWALGHKIAGSILAGLTIILIGIKSMVSGYDLLLSSGALISSALVTVIAAIW